MIVEPIQAEYITHSGCDLLVVDAARASFKKKSSRNEDGSIRDSDQSLINYLGTGFRTKEWIDLLQNIHYCQDANQVEDWLRNLQLKPQHFAPFAHPHLTLRITLPVFLARQYVKHQVGGVWSEESRRYVKNEPVFWFPDVLRTRPDDIKQGSGEAHTHSEYWLNAMYSQVKASKDLYMNMVSEGIAPEDARIILPLNHMSTVVWTGSLLFWSRVVNQRVSSDAQRAAQELGKKIADIVRPHYRHSWAVLTNGK